MKKNFAILLLLLFLFNLIGYQAIFSYLENKSELQMENMLDKQLINTHNLFEIKVPLNMPYIMTTHEFERFDGSIKIKGIYYNYFERKISNDTLILLCVFNAEENSLSKIKNLYLGMESNIQTKSKSCPSSLLLGLMKSKYDQRDIQSYFITISSSAKKYPRFNDNHISGAFVLSPEQPPEAI